MTQEWFFGYGSLVNLSTHSYPNAEPARLTGWRRVWKGTHLREIAFLSVEPDAQSTIDGLLAQVPGGDWAALDKREAAYRRSDVTQQITPSRPAVTYQVEDKHIDQKGQHPILLSYLDVVVQGYLRAFGEDGVENFFATTHGWNIPIKDDRSQPLYPRHQRLSRDELALVDKYILAVGGAA